MPKNNRLNKTFVKKIVISFLIFLSGIGFGYSYFTNSQKSPVIQAEKNTPKAFIDEIYDKISKNYWDNLSDAQLLELFKLSIEKNGGGGIVVKFDSKDKLLSNILETGKNMDEDKRNKFIASVVGTVLASLNPPQRSGLFTQKLEEQLKNTVENINPDKDLYKDLGVSKDASKEAIQQTFQKKSEELAKDTSEQARQKLKEITYAKDVLSKDDTKLRYDQNKVEPTIFSKIVSPGILYVRFKKFSPTSLDEFVKAFDSYKDGASVSSLILDLRGNVGGAIDSTAYFLGLFLGKNQSAFEFYHKGEYLPFKTPTDKLPSIAKYKQVVVLVDHQTQSSAEMMAASLKKYHVGVVVGVPTKGWGTVERVFQIDNQFDKANKYSLFLVHSITLRDDNLPIEGRGVEPDINTSHPDWEQQLYQYFRNPQFTSDVKQILSNPD